VTSLQGRMLLVVGVTILLCWAGALTGLGVYLSQSNSSVWDDKLRSIANQILITIPTKATLPKDEVPTVQLHRGGQHDGETLAFQVWVGTSRLMVRTPQAPATPLRADFTDGFDSRMVDGQRWRVYSVSDSTGKVHVQVGNLHSVMDAQLRNKAFIALGLVTLLLALAGAGMWWAVRRALQPVVALQSALRRRHHFDLTPLPAAPLPTELHPLVDAFNHQLRHLDEAVQAERRFIGDAAHELRTPLAALQAQAQVALQARASEDKDAALVKLLAVAQRSTRLSEQLLDLAKLDAGQHAAHQSLADLSELALHVVREFDVQAQQQGRHIVLATEPCGIACDVDEVGILLRNLIDNALRYTGTGGQVRIRCAQLAGQGGEEVLLEVADDGPGVPPAEHQAVFRRFHRVAGNRARGSGIGLSLVAGIAQLHGARIETGTGLDGRGFGVRVLFPVPAPPARDSATEVPAGAHSEAAITSRMTPACQSNQGL
jgi:signal transduction histidine kinase